jgi:hypothetical protein
MKKDFVPRQQSLELKELGFDEECFGFYDSEDLYISTAPHSNGNRNSSFIEPDKTNNPKISAPTFSQAFRWFREKYGYLPFIDMDNYSYYRFNIYKGRGISEAPFETYEEAEIACLNKLIEIVKNRQS